MSAIRLATAANVRAFQILLQGLGVSDNKWAESIDYDALEDEIGRFRVWSGNLGALQKGHSSLDYRLRDSPLLSSNAIKFLKELEENLNEANAVVSGARLPYEQQAKEQDTKDEDEDDDDDDFFDDDDDDDEEEEDSSKSMRTELNMRFAEIVDIIDNLYKLSVRIRTPTIRSRSLKAATYHPKDPETGVDLLGVYAGYDIQHIKELLEQLRNEQAEKTQSGAASDRTDDTSYDYLVMRLSAAITSRRQQFKYWKRHRDKLGVSTILEDKFPVLEPVHRPEPQRNDTLEALPELPVLATLKEAPSQRTARTMLSGTEATQHHQSLDEIVDTKSVTSYAVTVKDIHGKGIQLPPPPKAADGERDFECPYCYIICPARYGRGRAWKTHLLQDLQPYICTYRECESAEQLFRSRREWAAHEATHRKAWRCPEHPTAIFKSQGGLEEHLRKEHADSLPLSQLPAIVKVGETTTTDTRSECPICFAPPGFEGLGDFHNHIANHLERIATFALPIGTQVDEDGESSVASRGQSDSADSRNLDDVSLPKDDEIVDNTTFETAKTVETPVAGVSHETPTAEGTLEPSSAQPTLLSMANLDQIPDATQARIETLFKESGPPEPDQSSAGKDGEPSEISEDEQQFRQHKDALQNYFQSFQGFKSISFSRHRTGQVIFEIDELAASALNDFDDKLFPLVRIQLNMLSPDTLNIMFIKSQGELDTSASHPAGDLENAAQEQLDPKFYDVVKEGKEPILNISDIPTLRSMYRSRLLIQRDQSFLPNDTYNQTISFCHYDLTRIKVDAIVNSANRSLKPTHGETLNNTIFRAAGPELAKETKKYSKIGPQAVLTPAFNLPSNKIIHVLRPGYLNPNATSSFNQLKDCYRQVLRVAVDNGIKSVAFPCLGTGGVGIPAKMAARIALLEVREFLDALPDYKFERIVFCVNGTPDENAYVSLLPAYFPPTFDDVDIARSSVWMEDRGSLSVKVLDTRTELQKVFHLLNGGLSETVSDFSRKILSELNAIDHCLASIRKHLLWKQDASGSLKDLKLVCSVLISLCGNMTETIDLARDVGNTEAHRDKTIWDDYIADWRIRHGTDLASFLQTCRDFVECLDDMITRGGDESAELDIIRLSLDGYKNKRRAEIGEGDESRRSAFDEVLYLREYQREAIESTVIGDIVKLSQVRSLSELYKLGELEEKITLAHPSAMFNHTVCLVRENITKLQVDVIVNSTDPHFASMGTLDRAVFAKGGPEMRKATAALAGQCKEGDVMTTPGYALPAKFVLHVIPPRQYGKDPKKLLRTMYHQILHSAVSMRATSIAIPSLGTGMLNYPRRDTASLALEEVKRFLETAPPNSLIEKIVFVVYSSNDEYVYKSLMPVYFPPIDLNANRALPASQPIPTGSSDSSEPPRRTLFSSIGEAIRSVRFSQPPVPWRRINTSEEMALLQFDAHADGCHICKDPKRVYLEERDLCERGYQLGQNVLKHMNMREDQKIYSTPDNRGRTYEVEVPGEQFPLSRTLLEAVERSFRDGKHDRPFVSPNRPYSSGSGNVSADLKAAEAINLGEGANMPADEEYMEVSAHISINHEPGSFTAITKNLLSVRIYNHHVEVHDPTMPKEGQSRRLRFSLDTSTSIERYKTSPEVVVRKPKDLVRPDLNAGDVEVVLFRCTNDMDCSQLTRKLRQVQNYSFHAQSTSSTLNDSPKLDEKDDSILESKDTQQTKEPASANKKLQDFLNQLSSSKKASGGLSDLQFKIDRLNKATSKLELPMVLQSNAPDPRESENQVDESLRSAVSALVLEYLTQDLKTRPGSYIGTRFDDIVSNSGMRPALIDAALQDLKSRDLIHNTVDDKTWVVSDPPEGLSVVSKDSSQRAAPIATASTSSSSEPPKWALSHTALWILSNIPYKILSSNEAGVHRHISLKSEQSVHEVERALWELSQKTRWYPGSPSPRVPEIELDPDVLIAGNPAGPDGWTLIDKSIVDPRILRSSGIIFKEGENRILLPRTFQEADLLEWAERSREVRQSQGPGVQNIPQSAPAAETAQAATHEEPLSTLASSIHGYFVLNHDQSFEVDNLAVMSGFSHDAMATAVSELESHNLVHQVEDGKWTVTKSAVDKNATAEDGLSTPGLGQVASKVMDHLLLHPEETHHIETLCSILNFSQEEIQLGLVELSVKDLVHHLRGPYWELKKLKTTEAAEAQDVAAPTNKPTPLATEIREAKPFINTPPSPTIPAQETPSQLTSALANINIDDFISYPSPFGSRWTRLDKRLVHPKVLADDEEEFDDTGDSIIVHRVLRRGEIERWAERSAGLQGWLEDTREARERRRESKGKGRARDDAQERLDRVLAGDAKEDELRYFADDAGDERYI